VLVLAPPGAYDLWGKAPIWGKPGEQQHIIQVDTAPQSLGENREVDLAILGDVGAVVRAIRGQLAEIAEERPEHAQMAEYRSVQEGWLDNFRKMAQSDSGAIHPLRLVSDVRSFFPRNAVAVIDGGNTAIWGHYLTRIYEPGGLLWHGDSGMGGGGLPKAIAAALVRPDRPVFAILGDGFFAMNMQELETATRLGTNNLVVAVANDRAYGMIKAPGRRVLQALHRRGLLRRALRRDSAGLRLVRRARGTPGRDHARP
jgi:acetolactate synthase-1/2/3 large subunit